MTECDGSSAEVRIIIAGSRAPHLIYLDRSETDANRLILPGAILEYPREWEFDLASQRAVDDLQKQSGITIEEIHEIGMTAKPWPTRILLGYYQLKDHLALKESGRKEYNVQYGIFPHAFDQGHNVLLNGYLQMLEKEEKTLSSVTMYIWERRNDPRL